MNYRPLIEDLATNALLHLEFEKLKNKPRHTPIASRNIILGKYLKDKLKLPKYKLVKKDMKSLVLLSKKPNANIEKRLDNLLAIQKATVTNHLDAFFYVVSEIERAWNVEFKMLCPAELILDEFTNKALIIPTNNIGAHFKEDDNALIEPIIFLCRGAEKHITMLEGMINSQWFTNQRVTTEDDERAGFVRIIVSAK